jgi:hypothetical protein
MAVEIMVVARAADLHDLTKPARIILTAINHV